jgi:Uma2 family endonuclease
MASTAPSADRLVTADELLLIPDDGFRRELVRGEVRVMTPAGRPHGRVASRILSRLERHVEARSLGESYAAETGFRLTSDPDTVLAPDASFVRRERLEKMGETEGFIPGAPDLAVEVISPRDSFADVEDKVSKWIGAGCRMVVVVNPRSRLTWVYQPDSHAVSLTDGDVLDGGDVVPGWKLPLRELFA